jgi:transcriptional regulator MraZ
MGKSIDTFWEILHNGGAKSHKVARSGASISVSVPISDQSGGDSEQVFLGEYTHTLDDKGRLTLPARWREELSDGVVITRGLDPCLLIIPASRFEDIARTMDQLGFNKLDARALSRYLFAKAIDDTPDKQGRVNIPTALREFAGINGDALIVGVNNWIEIWNIGRYNEANAQLESNVGQASERMGDVMQRALLNKAE